MKGSLLEYSLLPDGNVAFKSVLINFEDWGPDGIKVDAEGNLYLALDGKIGVYSPKGEKLTDIIIRITPQQTYVLVGDIGTIPFLLPPEKNGIWLKQRSRDFIFHLWKINKPCKRISGGTYINQENFFM